MKDIELMFMIPNERLGVLLDLDFEKRFIIEKSIEKDWIKNRRCKCVGKLKNGDILICNHIKKEINKKTKEIRKKIRMKTFVFIYRGFLREKLR